MLAMIARRLLGLVPVLFFVSLGVFTLIKLIPGDAAVQLAGGQNATPERIAEVRNELHLNDPFLSQYGRWLGGAVRGDFGKSLVSGQNINSELRSRLSVTLSIVFGALALGLFVGVLLGIVSGMWPGSAKDRIAMLLASVGVAVPNFVLAILLLYLLTVRTHFFPPSGFTHLSDSPALWLKSIFLPSVSLCVLLAMMVARQLRA